ncbi:MAG: hypothetical protein JJ895_15810 [Balneolaceae bacterium]|nr:hypothetical protein [Balneolaceae bacterium]
MVRAAKLLLFFSFAVLLCKQASAQEFNIQSLTVNDGLPSSNIHDIYADDNGFLWLATPYGLIRYDGKEYVTFDEDEGVRDGLIYDFHFEEDGDIWIITGEGGLAKFDGQQFSYLPEIALFDSLVINYVTSIRKDELWIATEENGVAIWNQQTNEINFIDEDDGLIDNQVWDIHFQSDNKVWLSTMNGISVYEREVGISENYTLESGLSGNATYELVTDQMGRAWVATSNGVSIIQPDGGIDTILDINGEPLGYVYSIEVDNEGTVWIGTERKGAVLIDQDGNRTHITNRQGLSSNFIYRIVKDNQGNIWIATDGNGVNIVRDRKFKFYGLDSELGAKSIFALKKGRAGELWMTTENGLAEYKNGNFKNYAIPKDILSYDEIWDIEELANGDLLFLTYNFEVLQFNGTSFFKPTYYDKIYPYYLSDILVDMDGSIWFSTQDALLHYVDDDLDIYASKSDSYWKNSLGALFQDSRQQLWICTEDGLAKFENGVFSYFDSEHGIDGKSVYEITEDPYGNIWLGTNGGIYFLRNENIEANDYQFQKFEFSSLEANETVFLKFDTKGNLWQSTNSGLNYFVFDEPNRFKTFKNLHYNLSNAEFGLEFNGDAVAIDDDGTLWFGSNSRGLVSYHPPENEVISFSEPPQLFLRSIFANDELVYSQSSDSLDTNNLSIEFSKNDLTFNFNAIDYLNRKGKLIKYTLAGYDDDWKTEEDISTIRYTNLPPGDYTLQVAAKSMVSDWSEPAALTTFTVKKPFYLSVPFFLLLGISLAGLIAVYINSRISRLERIQLQKVVEQQTKELREALHEKEVLIKEIHHRVKNNLAVISGLLELQGFKMPAGEAKLAIQESRMRVVAMSKIHENLYQNNDLANVDFRKFIQDLVKGIQQTMDLAEKNIEVISYIDDVQLNINVGVPLGMIINELISNAYKHAFIHKKEGSINITFKEQDDVYKLIVADDGVGTDANILNSRHKSLGISLIKSLCVQIGGYIEYETKSGAHFKLTLPKKSLT